MSKSSNNHIVSLTKKLKGATVIEGFPGVGLVATIATGFLNEHLKCEKIGTYYFSDPPATAAIHSGHIVNPVTVYYNKKYNLVIIHSIMNATGLEFHAADLVLDVCNQVQAKELIALEGVSSGDQEESQAFHYCSNEKYSKILQKLGVPKLNEGIIVGTTGALLLKASEQKIPLSAIFVGTHMSIPDSKAAAKAVEVLDKYLGLNVPYKPLLLQAEKFEAKLRFMIDQTKQTSQLKEQKDTNYVG